MGEEPRIVGASAFQGWAIVELMGHRIRAGLVQEVEVAGGKMLRVDIPTEGGDVTEFYSTSALYSLRPCSEEIARRQANGYNDPRPVRPVEYRDRTPRLEHDSYASDQDE